MQQAAEQTDRNERRDTQTHKKVQTSTLQAHQWIALERKISEYTKLNTINQGNLINIHRTCNPGTAKLQNIGQERPYAGL